MGYRYVMGEREGWGHNGHSVDEFAGIGTHIHEIGHLIALSHPDGRWEGENPYTNQSSGDVVGSETVRFNGANLSGWGSMQNGAHGPPRVGNNGWTWNYPSCPNPFNPFFRKDLDWNTGHEITSTTLNQRIDPGPHDYYVVPGENDQDYILDFRTADGFGQYTGWHHFTTSPGLLIWRRSATGRPSNAMLIPADGRSIFDARHRPVQAEPTGEDSTYTYLWQDRLSDPFGAAAQPHGPTVAQTDTAHLLHATIDGGANPRPDDPHLSFRNIRNNGDHALVDIYTNYWSGSITGSVTWSDTVYVGGDVTVDSAATLTISAGTLVRFFANSDDQSSPAFTSKSGLKVFGTLIAEGTSTNKITFESDATSPGKSDWEGIQFYASSVDSLCKVNHTIIKHGHYGIYSYGATPAELNNNEISDCVYGILGIGVPSMESPTIQGNTVRDNSYGLYLANATGTGNGIQDNAITDNDLVGVYLSTCSVPIYGCTIRKNNGGVRIGAGSTSTLDSCRVDSSDRWGIYAFGINADPVLKNCTIAYNDTVGMRMFYGAGPVLDDPDNPNEFYSNGSYELFLKDNCQPHLDDTTATVLNDIVPTASGSYAVYIDQSRAFNKVHVRKNYWGASPTAAFFSPADSIIWNPYSSTESVSGTPKVVVAASAVPLQEARVLERRGQLMEAAEIYRDWVTDQPEHPKARYALSRLYTTWRNSGQDMLAFSEFARDVEQRATTPGIRRKARDWKLRSLLNAGRIAEALAGYRAIAASAPRSPEGGSARINIADIFHHYLGDIETARAEYAAIAADFAGEEEAELAQMALADLQGWVSRGPASLELMAYAVGEPAEDDKPPGIVLEAAPNPANPAMALRFTLPEAMPVELQIYNMLGQRVRTLVPPPLGPWLAGEHRVVWDGRDSQGRTVSSGVYVATLRAGEQVNNKKLTILR